ncbi:MAG: GNAT family N-acetyltransferase [Thermoplasmata archaeon]|nr:MAG: GNAT family N-acetyltransferase [Thermoplasmata archaeon]
MKKLARRGVYSFIKMEDVDDLDKFEIGFSEEEPGGEFGFFKGLGMVDYSKAFKTWLREFPRPIFILAVKEKTIIAWVYITSFEETPITGDSIYVLRAIETLPKFRSRKLGFRLLILGLNQTSGYMITKPLNAKAEQFFKNAGFMSEDEFRHLPFDLSRYHGYLILPPFKKQKILGDSSQYFTEDE